MNEILPSEYEVTVNPDGDILSIQRDNMSIPPARGNRHYEEFLLVDTEEKLCPRVLAHEYTDEAELEKVRTARNKLLVESDILMLPDNLEKLTDEEKIKLEEVLKEYNVDLKEDYANNTYDAIVIAVAHDQFKKISLSKIEEISSEKPILIDIKRLFDETDVINRGICYWSL